MSVVLGLDPGLASLGYVVVELLAEPVTVGGLFGPKVSERLLAAGTIETRKSDKRSVRKSDDQLRRIVEQAEHLGAIVRDLGDDLGAICAEAQSWPHPPELETTAFLERDHSARRAKTVAGEILTRFDAGGLERGELARRLAELTPPPTSFDSVNAKLAQHTSRTYGVLGSSTMIAMSWGVLGCLAALLGVPVAQASPQRVRSKLLGKRGGRKEELLAALRTRYGDEALEPILRMPKTRRMHASDAMAAVVATLDDKPIARLRAAAEFVDEDIDFG